MCVCVLEGGGGGVLNSGCVYTFVSINVPQMFNSYREIKNCFVLPLTKKLKKQSTEEKQTGKSETKLGNLYHSLPRNVLRVRKFNHLLRLKCF